MGRGARGALRWSEEAAEEEDEDEEAMEIASMEGMLVRR